MRILYVALFAVGACLPAGAASPYAGQQSRAIKALSAEEVTQLREGAGMGFAKAAELNRYPGPMHALEHAAALRLTDAQRGELEALLARLGEVTAKLRGSHLKTHLQTTAILTPAQVERYVEVRGYAGTPAPGHRHH